jgi:hypothetical protein
LVSVIATLVTWRLVKVDIFAPDSVTAGCQYALIRTGVAIADVAIVARLTDLDE